ncbi:FAD-dependent oxidoreductase [Fulvimarina sp. 2208YS6-2-32]|uniref:FAD-dependent oxidoreductase n=1 Tax=Fulvimarina uroteuthidis TaxID=3098149 RepID=UPI003A100114
MRITILGAGVMGLCAATELVRRGACVRLLDPKGPPGPHGCSWWAGGMLAPFCEAVTAEASVVRLGQEAAAWWEGAGASVIRAGTLVVALGRDRVEVERFAARSTGHRILDAEGLDALEPGLSARFSRALHFPGEAHLDPRAALAALHVGLSSRGVDVEAFHGAADGTGGSDTDITIDCRGLAAADTLPDLRGVRGEMAVLRAPDVALSRPVRLLHPRHPLYIVPRGEGLYMLGATQIETAHRGPVTARSVLELMGAAYALDPAFGEAEVLELGADARPAFPDNLPRIRRRGSTILVNGLFRHGFLLSPALARMVADLVLDGKHPEVMDEDHGEW